MILFDIRTDDSHDSFLAGVNRALDLEPGHHYRARWGYVGSESWWAAFDRGEMPVQILEGDVSFVGCLYPEEPDEGEEVIEFIADGERIAYDRAGHWAAHPVQIGDRIRLTCTEVHQQMPTGPLTALIDIRCDWFPTLPPDTAALWDEYLQAEQVRIRSVTNLALDRFVAALLGQEESRWRAWALDLARSIADEGADIPVRLPLFRQVLLPALTDSVLAGEPGCARWLAHFDSLLARSDTEPLPEELRSAFGLLREAVRVDPDDLRAHRQIADRLPTGFEYSLHEMPAGVLYGHDGATIPQCDELMALLETFVRSVAALNETERHADLIAACRLHFPAYRHYLSRPRPGQTYAAFLAERAALPSETPIAAVMVHVADLEAGLDWYQRAFPTARRVPFADPSWACLLLDGVQIELVPADSKVGSGPAGSVVYWKVADFAGALAHLESIGATLYRGPMEIEGGLRMCQVRDPWGNCIGLRGP